MMIAIRARIQSTDFISNIASKSIMQDSNMFSIKFIVSALAIAILCLNSSASSNSTSQIGLNRTFTKPNHLKKDHTLFVSLKLTDTKNLSTSLLNATMLNKANFGEDASQSIFKPAFFKNFLGDRRNPASSGEENEPEEEEVTKTIVVPMKESEAKEDQVIRDTTGRKMMLPHFENVNLKNMVSSVNGPMTAEQNDLSSQNMKPEASLQLTSTEMNSILHDKEAPEFYRERELNGDGVFVGEENAGLWTSASGSDRFGNQGFGFGQQGADAFPMQSPSSFEASDPFANQRLSQAASADAGFHHRFGSQALDGPEELGLSNSGRLMQSPNEYSEFNAGPAEFARSSELGGGSAEYSPQSGLLRASSEEFNGASEAGFRMGGGFEGLQGINSGSGFQSGGYPNSHRLEKLSSELYGTNGFGLNPETGYSSALAGSGNQFGGPDIYSNRILSAGSHHQPQGDILSASQHFGPNQGYASRFGQHSADFSRRNFATQNSLMSRDNSVMSGLSSPAPFDHPTAGKQAAFMRRDKLLPLSSTVPIQEPSEFNPTNHGAGQGSYREASNQVEKGASVNPDSFGGEQQPQVHESMDDEATEPGDDGEEEQAAAAAAAAPEGIGGGEPGPAASASDEENLARASNLKPRDGPSAGGSGLILNVPPPNMESPMRFRPTVDFTRIGSAGYLGPSRIRGAEFDAEHEDQQDTRVVNRRRLMLMKQDAFLKKNGLSLLTGSGNNKLVGGFQQPSFFSPSSSAANYNPADNPAHAGKYIID